jgi:DNA-binding CsgD family transcriptional regulator
MDRGGERHTSVRREDASPAAGTARPETPDLVEDDPLVRAAAREAVLNTRSAVAGAVVFVGVHGLVRVAECPLRRGQQHADPVVLYTLRDELCARLHSLHGCADGYGVLVTADLAPGTEMSTGARFEMLCGPEPLAAAGITAREAEVLALMIARHSDAEIAVRLVISVTTVRTHCRSILRKLGAHSRRDLRDRLLPE